MPIKKHQKKQSKKSTKGATAKTTKAPPQKDNQIELLKSIVEDLINKQSVPILDLLSAKKPVNEFTIAEKLGLTINQTRNIFYKLSDFGLVSFTRKKDKRKGWYIYFWTLNTQQSILLLEEKLQKKLDELKNQLKNRKNNRYYICEICMVETNEETALLNNFTCPECTSVYTLVNDTEITKNIGKEMAKIEKELELVQIEVRKQQEKTGKEKERKIIREEKERKEKRMAARLLRLKEKKKLERVTATQKKVKKARKVKKSGKVKKKVKKINKQKKKKLKR